MRFADELEESRYSKTIAEIKNKQSFHSTGMSRNMPEDVRLTRTSSFGQNNVKGKLDTFDGITTTLSGEMRQLLADTDKTKKYCQTLKRQLLSELDSRHKRLMTNAKGLENAIKAGTDNENGRMNQVNNKCDQLIKQSGDLKSKFNWLKARIDGLEQAMGYYSAIDKYKS